MKLREEHIGKKTYIKALKRLVEVCEENVPVLVAHNKHEFFVSDLEMKPIIKTKQTFPKMEVSNSPVTQAADRRYLLDKLSTEALKDFEGRGVKSVKKDFDSLEIAYPKNASLKMLAEIMKTL